MQKPHRPSHDLRVTIMSRFKLIIYITVSVAYRESIITETMLTLAIGYFVEQIE